MERLINKLINIDNFKAHRAGLRKWLITEFDNDMNLQYILLSWHWFVYMKTIER